MEDVKCQIGKSAMRTWKNLERLGMSKGKGIIKKHKKAHLLHVGVNVPRRSALSRKLSRHILCSAVVLHISVSRKECLQNII